jgi:hypothetical protein
MQTGYGDPQVIDAHVHFFSHQFFQSFLRSRGRQFPERDPQRLLERLGWEVPPPDPVELGRRWVEELDCHAVEHLGLKGIKGVPAMECFHAYAERVYPVYEEAQ